MMMFKAQEINMLDTNMKTQLKAYLEKLTKPVELIATLDDSAKSAEIKELLAEIAELSDKVTFKEDNSLPVRKPSFLITNPGSNQGPRFAGSPLGHEFTSLVLALLWTGGHPSKEAQSLLEQIRHIDGDFEFETYYSLSCHNCPDVVQALNLMSVLNPRIKHTAIDGGTFQNEITDRNVMGVPAVFVNSLTSSRTLPKRTCCLMREGSMVKWLTIVCKRSSASCCRCSSKRRTSAAKRCRLRLADPGST